ncbi:choice-of-anchor X domain-containing protein [Motilimonas cestriensis]|uniref:choice-of-anchor X domain-containing protein n=1 Tax=Motilimonas cestriensis TaxID=2742685 RepID=UPI003DA6638C
MIVLFLYGILANANNMIPLSSTSDQLGFIDTPFKKQDTKTIVKFEVTRGQSFLSTIVIPITGASFELIAADGTVVIDSKHSDIKVTQGNDIEPDLPGASYELPLIDAGNRVGVWQFVIDYDAPGYDSMVVTQIFKKMEVSAIIAIAGHLAVVGDLMAPSVLVTANGNPISDANVSFLITFPDGSKIKVIGYDNGLGFDAVAGDGVFSTASTYPYQQLGEHVIEADVTAQHLGFEYQAKTGKNIVVTEQLAMVNKTELMIPQDTCVENLILKAKINFSKAGTYDLLSILNGSLKQGKFGATAGQRIMVTEGEHEFDIVFDKNDLLNSFSEGEIVSFSPLFVKTTDLSNAGTREFNSVVNPLFAIPDTFYVEDINFCHEDIEVTKKITTTENMSSDKSYIESLEFSFPVYVNKAGSYTTSLSIISKDHQILDTINFSSSLSVGDNRVKFTVDGGKLKAIDGPYLVRSLLFYGNGKNKWASQLGETAAYKKEKFIPK